MPKKITIYIHDENLYKLEEYKNKSKIVNEALNMLFNNQTFFESRQQQLKIDQEDLEYKLKVNMIKQKENMKHIEEINKKRNYRPDNYEKTVQTLINMKEVNTYDLMYQAEQLGVNTDEYRGWLLKDGYYEKIFID